MPNPENRAGLWARNGQTIKLLVNFYRSSRFAGQTFDLDLHGLQVAFSKLAESGDQRRVIELLCGSSHVTTLAGEWLRKMEK